jgi:hypothetical protein
MPTLQQVNERMSIDPLACALTIIGNPEPE